MARPPHRHGFRNASDPAGGGAEELNAEDLTALAERRPEALERFAGGGAPAMSCEQFSMPHLPC